MSQEVVPVVSAARPRSKAAGRVGWVLSIVISLFIGSGGVNALLGVKMVTDSLSKFGFTAAILPAMGVTELLCAVLFLIPQTAALGAILFTAFFGGAVITHARIGDPTWPVPVLFGVVVWIALLLRDPRFHIIRPSQYTKP